MTRTQLIKHLAKNSKCSRETVERVMNELEYTIIHVIANEEKVKMFPGFELHPKIYPPKLYTDFWTKEKKYSEEKLICKLYTSKSFIEKVGIIRDQNK